MDRLMLASSDFCIGRNEGAEYPLHPPNPLQQGTRHHHFAAEGGAAKWPSLLRVVDYGTIGMWVTTRSGTLFAPASDSITGTGIFIALRLSPLLGGLHEENSISYHLKQKHRRGACVVETLMIPSSTQARPSFLLESTFGHLLFRSTYSTSCLAVDVRHGMNHETLFLASLFSHAC